MASFGPLPLKGHSKFDLKSAGLRTVRLVSSRRSSSWNFVAASTSRSTEAKIENDAEDLQTLQMALDMAIMNEDYNQAAKIRDQIKEVELADPLTALRAELEVAVSEERYGDAALLRDQIKELEPPPPPPPPPLETTSNRVTEGVRVQVQSSFVPQQSQPDASAYLFTYEVTITNESHPTKIKLVSRNWTITDDNGKMTEVQGPGVVGQQPELAPGESFTYQSACPLKTSRGTMKGTYEMYSRASDTSPWTTSFLVEIGEFGLDVQGPSSF